MPQRKTSSKVDGIDLTIHESETSHLPVYRDSTMGKFDPNDTNLDGLLAANKEWAKAVIKEDPEFFKVIAEKQEPSILWIGKVFANLILFSMSYMFTHTHFIKHVKYRLF